MEMMNNAIMFLNFFEPINRFVEKPHAYKQGQEEKCSDHLNYCFAKPIAKPGATGNKNTQQTHYQIFNFYINFKT